MPSRSDIESNEYMQGMRREALAVLAYWNRRLEDFDNMGVQVSEIRVQGPSKTGADVRVIVKAATEDGRLLVAFGNGHDIQSALADLKSRDAAVGIKWGEDKPWNPDKGK